MANQSANNSYKLWGFVERLFNEKRGREKDGDDSRPDGRDDSHNKHADRKRNHDRDWDDKRDKDDDDDDRGGNKDHGRGKGKDNDKDDDKHQHGGDGDDELIASDGTGHLHMEGGSGADVFALSDGRNVHVEDFAAGAGNTNIDLGGGFNLYLFGVTSASLYADTFLF